MVQLVGYGHTMVTELNAEVSMLSCHGCGMPHKNPYWFLGEVAVAGRGNGKYYLPPGFGAY